MSDQGNHDIDSKDIIAGFYKDTPSDVWLLRFQSGWQIGLFLTLDEAVLYALENYSEHFGVVQ